MRLTALRRVRTVWVVVYNIQGVMCPVLEVSSALKGLWLNLSQGSMVQVTVQPLACTASDLIGAFQTLSTTVIFSKSFKSFPSPIVHL